MKRTKKSQKKTKFLLILIVLTAILSITATYAWFSTQKDVEISTLRLNIEVAESLEISLNGKEWANTITISDMKQLYGTAASGHQASKYEENVAGSGNNNYIPTKLLPVSTTGGLDNGKLQFMTASSFSGNTLKAIACNENDLTLSETVANRQGNNDKHPYLVFDMYLKNLSAKETGDPLLLNTESRVWTDTGVNDTYAGASKADTGAEYAMRVGFVQYMNTLDAATSTETGKEVRALTANRAADEAKGITEATAKVAIWEPNDLNHIQEVVNNNSRVTNVSENVTTYGIIYNASALAPATAIEVDTSKAEAIEGKTAEQNTVKPQYNLDVVYDKEENGDIKEDEEGKPIILGQAGTKVVMPLTTGGTSSDNNGASVTGDIILPQNTISKFRVYVWLEGQDVDCINTASMAGKLDVKIRLTKEGSNGAGGANYDTVQNGG